MSLKDALVSIQAEMEIDLTASPTPSNSEPEDSSSPLSLLPLLDYSQEDADAAGIVVVENTTGVDVDTDAGVIDVDAEVAISTAMASSESSEFADAVVDSSFTGTGTETTTTPTTTAQTQSPTHSATATATMNTNTNTNIIVKTEAATSRKKTTGPTPPPQIRIPILRGTLYEKMEWDDQCEETKRKHILKGTWRFNDDTTNTDDDNDDTTKTDSDEDQSFELIRLVTGKEDDTPEEGRSAAYFTPSNGMYHGTFRLSYVHTTPKGKRSTKVTTMEEKNVKLEFRKLQMTASSQDVVDDGTPNFYYRIHGSGINEIGRFSLGGTAKQVLNSDTYNIELRKTYFGLDTATTTKTNSRQTTTTGSLSSSSSSSLLLQSQKQTFSPTRIKNEPRSPSLSSSSTTHNTAVATAAPTIPRQTKKPTTKTSQQKSPKPTPQPQPAAAATVVATATTTTTTMTRTPPPPPPQQFQPPNYINNSGVDRVNGKGMWHAWTRSFDTPLLALLDLFDNAVDASWTLLPASSSSASESIRSKPKIRVEVDQIGNKGVVIRNASHCIPSLKQVLEVYKSSKTSEADTSIGENGIGVKHACASLSTLSLVFTKSKHGDDTYFSMGILMQELQLDVGIVLPSRDWHLPNNFHSMEDLKHELETVCQQEPLVWGKAIREYGDAESESKSNYENAADDSSSEGIDHCLRHFEILMKHRDWKEYDNVFAVVLTNLKHAAYDGGEGENNNEVILIDAATEPAKTRRSTSSAASKDATTAGPDDGDGNGDGDGGAPAVKESTYLVMEDREGEGDIDEDQERSLSLLDDLRNKLPYLYLHLHELDIVVDATPIESIYWERRLAELSKFELQISQTQLWSKISKEFYTEPFVDDARSVYHVSNPQETIRFFCGFDPYRCQNPYDTTRDDDERKLLNINKKDNDEDHGSNNIITSYVPGGNSGVSVGGNNSALKVFLYSRQSGRLIKAENDPRNDLGLTAGSTHFCQGLTIIIDDHNGTLPLNPTKQDTAYGQSKYGQIHAANLREWTAAIGHFYWNYHFSRLGNSKVAVTQAVSKSKNALEDAYHNFSKKKKQNNDGNQMDGDSDSLFSTLFSTTTSTPLYRGSFITFGHVDFALTEFREVKKIRAHKVARDKVVPNIAANEVVRLNEDAAALVVSDSARKKRKNKSDQDNFNSNNNNSGGSLMEFSQQQQQQQQQHHELILEKHIALESTSKKHIASPFTAKRLRSSQDEDGDLDRFLQSEQHGAAALVEGLVDTGGHNNIDHQQITRRQQSRRQSHSGNNSNLLNTRLQQYEDHNRQLQQQAIVQAQNVKLLQEECRKLTIEKQVDLNTIEKERSERDQWMDYGKSKKAESASLREAAEEMRRQLDQCQQQLREANHNRFQTQAASLSLSSREGVVDLTDGNAEEIAKLRQVVKQLKSSAAFYKKGNEAKTVQIENLMQEKSRFEDRVRELEGSQLDGMISLEF